MAPCFAVRASLWIVAWLLMVAALSGCASAPAAASVAPVPQDKLSELSGAWQGWLVTERSFALFNLVVNQDGTFEVTGQWTRAQGVLVVADGAVRFDGSGAWRGTLALEERGPRRVLRLERDDRLVRGYLHPVRQDS